MIAADALAFILRYWKVIIAGLITTGLVIALLIARSDAQHFSKLYDAERAAHALDLANVKSVTAKAVADNIADVRAKETDAAAITEDKQHDLESQLADARSSAAAYASRMRCPASSSGNTEGTTVSETAGTAHSADDNGMSIVPSDDVRICSENTVKVRGWIDYYSALRNRYNAATTP